MLSSLLERLHYWTVFVGSAAAVAFLANLCEGEPPPEPAYAYETIDGQRCLVETGSGTFVATEDGSPWCQQVAPATVRVAQQQAAR